MKFFPVIFFLFGFFSACINKNKIPGGILKQEQMREVMWDLILADEFAAVYIIKDTTLNLNTERAKLYEQVFRIHQIDREMFARSQAFYQSRPDLFKAVADSLRSDERRILNARNPESKIAVDSSQRQSIKIKPVRKN